MFSQPQWALEDDACREKTNLIYIKLHHWREETHLGANPSSVSALCLYLRGGSLGAIPYPESLLTCEPSSKSLPPLLEITTGTSCHGK